MKERGFCGGVGPPSFSLLKRNGLVVFVFMCASKGYGCVALFISDTVSQELGVGVVLFVFFVRF